MAVRESDARGGHDPYSSSKGCAELADRLCRSYFNKGETVVASVRAGNVIGGGDWARIRPVTDILSAVARQQKPVICNPGAIRPWQHVLEPLSGYLCAVEHLWERRPNFPECWNFGPDSDSEVCVEDVASQICRLWGFERGLKDHAGCATRMKRTGCVSTPARRVLQLGWRRLSCPSSRDDSRLVPRPSLRQRHASSNTRGQIKAYQENKRLEPEAKSRVSSVSAI